MQIVFLHSSPLQNGGYGNTLILQIYLCGVLPLNNKSLNRYLFCYV